MLGGTSLYCISLPYIAYLFTIAYLEVFVPALNNQDCELEFLIAKLIHQPCIEITERLVQKYIRWFGDIVAEEGG